MRQLAWRDFFHQLLAARPETAREDMHPRGDRWNSDSDSLEAWKNGETGCPIVDAGMRQLLREGYMHNRARLITASFLVHDLRIDWRAGARHFFDRLADGDVADNVGNWQWVAGTGANPRRGTAFNPLRQARRFDPDGAYVRTVTGATGLIGTKVVAALRERGDEVTVLSRRPKDAQQMLGVDAVGWHPEREPAPAAGLAGRDGVVHLAGEPIAQRWTRESMKRIRTSREIGTARLVEGLEQADPRPASLSLHPPSATTAPVATSAALS